MQEQIFSTIPIKELKLLITDIVNDCLGNHTNSNLPQKEIIDREELCKRLAITAPSVIRWEKKGKIPRLMIGSSIRYNWPAVIEALESQANKKGGRL